MHCSPITVQQSLVVKSARGKPFLMCNARAIHKLHHFSCQVDFRTVNECGNIIFSRTCLTLIRRFSSFRPHSVLCTSICFISNVASTSTGSSLPLWSSSSFIHQLQVTPMVLQALLTFSLSTLCLSLSASLSATVSYLYAATLVLVTFVAPGILVWAQKYKKCVFVPTRLPTSELTYLVARSEVPGTWLSQRLIDMRHSRASAFVGAFHIVRIKPRGICRLSLFAPGCVDFT